MTKPRSDALVLFGGTGDLACQKILPTLQTMVRKDRLDVDPFPKRPSPVHVYEPGGFGPREAERIVAHVGGWREVRGPQPKTA